MKKVTGCLMALAVSVAVGGAAFAITSLNEVVYAQDSQADENVVNGKCGEDAYFTLDKSTGTLVISGTGKVDSNAEVIDNIYRGMMFDKYKDYIKSVVIEEGITELSIGLFSGYTKVESVKLPESLKVINDYCFLETSIRELELPAGLKEVNYHSFGMIDKLENIIIYGCPSIFMTFSDCYNIKKVVIYDKNKSIPFHPADLKPSNVIIYCYKDSFTHETADRKNMRVVCLDEFGEDNLITDGTDVMHRKTGWNTFFEKAYWFEDNIKQGTYDDAQAVVGDGIIRGREIYDPDSEAWYWLDAVYDGLRACNKEVWVPYVYKDEGACFGDKENRQRRADAILSVAADSHELKNQAYDAIMNCKGKWVRYDADGRMIKGWYTVEGEDAAFYPDQVGNTYYYDQMTGLMAHGKATIDGVEYMFDEITGALVR